MKRFFLLAIALLLPLSIFAALPLGKVPPVVMLQGDDGGRVDGSPWSSEEISGKVFIMFYVDPDEKNLNDHVSLRLKEESFSPNHFASIAVINMDATWLPNSMIASSLKEKQKEFPLTTYVKDMEKVLVDKWNLGDDTSNVVAFDSKGQVIFSKDGKLSASEVDTLISSIKAKL